MAKQLSILTFTGKLGNMIGFRRNGRYFMRAMPVSVRQSTATRNASRRFGEASKMAALVRDALSALDIRKDRGCVNRFNRAFILSRLDVTQAMQGFQFNGRMATDRFLSIPPRVTGDGLLHFGAQQLPAGEGGTLEIKVITTRVDFATQALLASKTMTFYAGKAFTGTSMRVSLPGDGTLIVAVQVRRADRQGIVAGRDHWAAAIVTVQVPEEVAVLPAATTVYHDRTKKGPVTCRHRGPEVLLLE